MATTTTMAATPIPAATTTGSPATVRPAAEAGSGTGSGGRLWLNSAPTAVVRS